MEARARTRARPIAAWGVAVVTLVAVVLAAPARGSHPGGVPNWPELLPPFPGTPNGKVKLRFDVCPKGKASCPQRVVKKMHRRWRPLDRACDHDAVFALTYLRTTEEFVRTTRDDAGFFDGRRWINHEDAVFAALYFRAYDRWEKGRRVPEAWRIAFEAADSPDVTGIGDLLLGMNAHINRDLPYTLAHMGLVKRKDGRSRKPDHDRVNEFLDRVVDPVQAELARRYDPLFEATDAGPSPLDEIGALEAVKTMRENAWRNAERLLDAEGEDERRDVRASIEAEAAVGAQSILAANTLPGYGPARNEHCRSRAG